LGGTKQRHFPFFPEHWKGDVALRMCSSGARGLWIDMMCEMHSAEPYGHLVTPTGVPIATAEQIAKITGEAATDVKKWLIELESAQVFSRTEDSVIFSRRMVRDRQSRDEWVTRQRQSRDNRVTCEVCHADVTGESHECHGDVTPESRESHASKGKGKGKRSRSVSNETVSGPKKIAVVPGPTFDALEPDVVTFLALVAAENKSGKIAETREATLRRELFEWLDSVGRDRFAYGLREAIKHGKAGVGYAKKCGLSYSPADDFDARFLRGDAPSPARTIRGYVAIEGRNGEFRHWSGPKGSEPIGYTDTRPVVGIVVDDAEDAA
jgi:hypothetical protein